MNLKQFNPLKVLNHWQVLNDIVNVKVTPPVSCEIDPSNICNHNCIWCINDEFRKKNLTLLPGDVLMRVIEEIADEGVKSIAFTGGGEPLTNVATIEAIKKVTKLGMDAAIVTNGALLDSEKSKIIVDNCSYIRISLDAGSNETHKKIHCPKNTRQDNFEKIIENIKTLVSLRKKHRKKINIGIGYLVHSINHSEIYKTAKLVKNIGVDYIQIRPSFIVGEQLSGKIMFEVENQIQQAIKLSDSDFHVFPILHRFDEVKNLDKGYDRCYGHALVGVIAANGNMYLCCQLRGFDKFCFGSILKESFHDIWYGKRRQEVISRINLNECLPCRYNKYNEILDYLADPEKPHKNFL